MVQKVHFVCSFITTFYVTGARYHLRNKDTQFVSVVSLRKQSTARLIELLTVLQPSRKYTSRMVTKEMSKEIHTKASPFIQWLKEAEEESSEEDGEGGSDEEEVEVFVWSSVVQLLECSDFILPVKYISG